jgi:hypothetical protein
VFLAIEKSSSNEIVLKVQSLKSLLKKGRLTSILVGVFDSLFGINNSENEIAIQHKLNSSHVPVLYRVFYNKECLFMMEQRAGNKTLGSFLNKYFHRLTVFIYEQFYLDTSIE